MKLSRQKLWIFGAIALGTISLIILFAAPNSPNRSGSTYNRNPDGYGAWYAFMAERGTPVQRWQKSFQSLADLEGKETGNTLLRVDNGLGAAQHYSFEGQQTSTKDWVAKGNRLIILGVRQPVTEAPFRSQQASEVGLVQVDTGRRNQKAENQLLGDRFGGVVWSKSVGEGQIIYATTPHIAANAYQDSEGNYEFLAQLVTGKESKTPPPSAQLWVDEYIHGYKDTDAIETEMQGNVFSYWAKTPLLPAAIQGIILVLVAIWAGNRRFGRAIALSSPTTNNSKAYIEALAGVLQKAGSREFVLEILGKEEQRQLQQALGLGDNLLKPQVLVEEWVRQTGRPAKELERLLLPSPQRQDLGEKALVGWLGQWRNLSGRR